MEVIKQRILERLANGGTFNGKRPPSDLTQIKNLKRVIVKRDARIQELETALGAQKIQNQRSAERFARSVMWMDRNCNQLLERQTQNANQILRLNVENLKLIEEVKLLRSQNPNGTNTGQSLPPISIFSKNPSNE